MHECKLHNNFSQFDEKLKILLKMFDFNTVKNTSLGSVRYVCNTIVTLVQQIQFKV